MTDNKMNKADFYTSIVLITLSIGIIVISLRMPSMVSKNESMWSNPGVVPIFIGFALLMLSGSMFVRAIMHGVLRPSDNQHTEGPASDITPISDTQKKLPVPMKRMLITTAICIGYAFLLGTLWFPLVTFLFVFVFISVFEFDSAKKVLQQWKTFLWAAVIGIGTSAAVTIVFQYLFLVNLP